MIFVKFWKLTKKPFFSVIVLYTIQREDAHREPQLEVKKRMGVKCPISLVDKKNDFNIYLEDLRWSLNKNDVIESFEIIFFWALCQTFIKRRVVC